MEKGRKKRDREKERGREIHIISTIRTFYSSRCYSTLHFFPLPSYLSLAFIFPSFFFFFFFFLIYPRPFQRIISCAELLVPGVFSSLSPSHGRPPIDIFKRKAGTMRGFSCISSWPAAKFHFSCVSIITLSSGSGEGKKEKKRREIEKMKIASTFVRNDIPAALVNTRKRGTELN